METQKCASFFNSSKYPSQYLSTQPVPASVPSSKDLLIFNSIKYLSQYPVCLCVRVCV